MIRGEPEENGMAFADQAGATRPGSSLNQPVNSARSRIDNDISRVQEMANIVGLSTERIVGHARRLGYFEPPPTEGKSVEPVISTLDDALNDLYRRIQTLSGSLNVFD
jgi:hypothetical protein